MASFDLIDGYCKHLRMESASPRTIADRKRTLTVMDRDLPYGLDTANTDELRGWLWRDGLSMGSRETYYGAFISFFRWAYAEGHLDFNPADLVSRPKPPQRLPRPCTDEQLHDSLTRAREPYLLWVKLAAYAGFRCIDIANLRRERITENGISVIASKGGAARVVPTHPIIWEAVRDLPPGSITDLDAREISPAARSYLVYTLGITGISLHRYRHWFGTMIQRLYKDLRVTQELMGHTNPKTTAGYALVAAEQTRGAIDLLPRLDVVAFVR